MESRRGHELHLAGITQRFGDYVAVRDIDLKIGAGELVALLGPSGCGKSTLLRIISGFMPQTEGKVFFDGEAVDHLPPNKRGVGIVFQNYALFPHMTIRQNIAYGLEVQRVPAARLKTRVDEMLDLVHMGEFAERYPRQLSGGQQQRIALARCLAVDPKILLLDEPFGALDKNLRLDMQIEVKRLQREYGITTVLVTHDQEEALSMADRVAVMSRGRIEQIASPTDIYDRPETLFVNQFVGSTNVLPGIAGEMAGAGQQVTLACGERIALAEGSRLATGAQVQVSIRPEHLTLQTAPLDNAITGVIKAVMPLGPQVLYDIAVGDGTDIKVSVPRKRGDEFLLSGTRIFAAPVPPAGYRAFPV
ncbi:ABC transporter ATP-binding protein [Azoarcus sp. L1K30]|uniref:ABC transporter ATP-binding protein n=1 Tax=Azoarcus sp. L1K30 TaxID=2820277 RepID=UPI001B842A33|nr:ABC transporter ATP-binding protein [Azoarcus sp. L1K30]MBR0567299.1 ABC transporter ATP-binding protein [Azoarcus sp. L1K30]